MSKSDIKTIDLFAVRSNRTRSKMIEKILIDFIADNSDRKQLPLPIKKKVILTKNTVKIPSDIRRKIDLIAQKQAKSRNQVINDILKGYFKGVEK
jgi:metal-responsive CopG/Arc/MetJ family transcriptional regulator